MLFLKGFPEKIFSTPCHLESLPVCQAFQHVIRDELRLLIILRYDFS